MGIESDVGSFHGGSQRLDRRLDIRTPQPIASEGTAEAQRRLGPVCVAGRVLKSAVQVGVIGVQAGEPASLIEETAMPEISPLMGAPLADRARAWRRPK